MAKPGMSKRSTTDVVLQTPQPEEEAGQADAREAWGEAAKRRDLTPTEQQLFEEVISFARKLDKRGVPGVYALMGDIAETVGIRKADGLEVITALARGMDALKSQGAADRQKRREGIRAAIADSGELAGYAWLLMVCGLISAVVGLAAYPIAFYWAAGFFLVGLACLLPVLISFHVRR